MARASTDTLLSLSRWAAVLGLNPYYFSQAVTTLYPGSDDCASVWLQYAWMEADKVGREDVARAIAQAEADIATQLGYWPAPKWIVAEDQSYPRRYSTGMYGVGGMTVRGQGKSVRTDWKRVRAVGQRAKSLISAGAAVVIAGDTATVTAATSVTDASEIEVYPVVADGADVVASDTYRIRPVKIAISGGTATITGKKYLFIKPSLWETDTSLDGDAAATYLATVDVYRVYNDPSAAALFLWESLPAGCVAPDGSGCSWQTQEACVLMRNAEMGVLVPSPASWSVADQAFTASSFANQWDPDKVRLYYQAGYPLGADGEMDDYWARAVAYYAAALLGREACECGQFGKFLTHWQEDLALNAETGRSYQNGLAVLSNPFGTERGAVFAWQRIGPKLLQGGYAL